MSEFSRRVGEVGETIVQEYFRLIGWENAQANVVLPCNKPEKHKRRDSDRRSHGIDFLFSYASPLIDETLVNVVVSVKYTSEEYPTSPLSKFKDHFGELTWILECFKRSEVRSAAAKTERSIRRVKDVGVLLWLSDKENESNDLIKKVANANVNSFEFETIILVDNRRVAFVYDTLIYARTLYTDAEVEFHYFDTGKNLNPLSRHQNGGLLPVELINGSVLALRVADRKSNAKTLLISCIESFSETACRRLIGLAQRLTSDWVTRTVIAFPSFNILDHSNTVQQVKGSFEDQRSTSAVEVRTFSQDFRNLAV